MCSLGGGDFDTVDYSERAAPVNVAIDGTNNSGEAGEHDFLNPDIEEIRGGSKERHAQPARRLRPRSASTGRAATIT